MQKAWPDKSLKALEPHDIHPKPFLPSIYSQAIVNGTKHLSTKERSTDEINGSGSFFQLFSIYGELFAH